MEKLWNNNTKKERIEVEKKEDPPICPFCHKELTYMKMKDDTMGWSCKCMKKDTPDKMSGIING